MNKSSDDKFRNKKIKSVFTIVLAIVVTLAYNAILISYERAPQSTTISTKTGQSDPELPVFTLAEVAEHANEDSCWMAAYGYVYDVTQSVQEQNHPGGQRQLLSGCGSEVTEIFDGIHSNRARDMLAEFKIGILEL